MDYDAIVIGAGAAGLTAARDLARGGATVALVDARDRFGGRIREAVDPCATAPLELGPEFVHGRPPATYALLREMGAAVVDNAESSFTLGAEGLRPAPGDPFEAAAGILSRALDRAEDESVAELLARASVDDASRDAARWAERLVSGFDAADPVRASARAIATEWAGDASADGSQSRPVGGYAPLVAHLARSLDPARVRVMLRTTATRVARDARGVAVDVRGTGGATTLRARRVLVTVPIGVLQATPGETGAIAFDPPLPGAVRDALATIAMGPVVKVVLRFRDAFWETLRGGDYRDAAFFNGDGAFPTLWTQLPVRASVLTAWAGGPYASRLGDGGRDGDGWIAEALACAGRYFGDPAATIDAFEAGYVHDWQRDPFSRGAYSYATVGGEHAHAVLATPVDGTLFFAGEATAGDGEGGTVAGALTSGARAARLMA